jgi:hypothetical protein
MLARLRESVSRPPNWPVLISAASLLLAITGGVWALVQSQINTVKELTASDRQSIRRQLDENDKITAALRHDKLDVERFNQVVSHLVPASGLKARDDELQRQIDALAARLDKLEAQPRH